jgi:hypothetical protein
MVGALEIAIPALAFAKFGRSVTASVSQRRGLSIGIYEHHDFFTEQGKRLGT